MDIENFIVRPYNLARNLKQGSFYALLSSQSLLHKFNIIDMIYPKICLTIPRVRHYTNGVSAATQVKQDVDVLLNSCQGISVKDDKYARGINLIFVPPSPTLSC